MRMNRERIGGQFCSVYLDGVKQRYCIEADDVEGWALCGVVNSEGRLVYDSDGWERTKVETREGRVELRFDPPEWQQVVELSDALANVNIPGITFSVVWERL
jgi:hypothetical protein